MQEYIALARQGQHLVDVYVPQEPEVAQVEAILETHGASHMHYYGARDIADLVDVVHDLEARMKAGGG